MPAGDMGAGGAAGGNCGGLTSRRGGGAVDSIWCGGRSVTISSSALCCCGGVWRRFCRLLLCLFPLRDLHAIAAYGRFDEPTTRFTGDVSQH